MEKTCECGWKGTKIALHWNYNPEHRPNLTTRQKEILTGLLLGDAWMNPNGYMAVDMVEREFLEWVDDELGLLSCGVSLDETAEVSAEQNRKAGVTVNEENYRDKWRLRTVTHPEIKDFLEWYSTGEKVFPEEIGLTPLTLKVWYCCDGTTYEMESEYWDVRLAAYNETDRLESLAKQFDETGIQPKAYDGILVFGSDERDEFFDYVGESLPGFGYKWEKA